MMKQSVAIARLQELRSEHVELGRAIRAIERFCQIRNRRTYSLRTVAGFCRSEDVALMLANLPDD